ncbi:glycosyltransferase [Flavobacterium sp.]|jgi:glycosyltransferase involved in cell wall biosynthesis|uniref:glycosyltransferase n=1 Tax=Flavobacterium sp. TaxID=239 RepID=UPI0037BF3CAF
MKNILLIMPYGGVGGMERLALNFYNQYKKKGCTVKVLKIIQLNSDIVRFGENEIALSTIDFIEMPFWKRFWFYCKIPFLIHHIIKKNKITHSISFGDMANVFSSLSFSKEFKVASIHSFKSIEFKEKNFLNKIFKLAYKTTYFFFNKVVCISETVKLDLIKNCGFKFQNKLKVLYNPHDFEAIDRLSDEHLESVFEEELFQNKVILFLGRLTLVKAPWHLIKAFSLLKNLDNSMKLVFIGDGDEGLTNYLLELTVKLGIKENVVFLGRKSNPYPYLKRASILALTSYYEGTPNVIVEAIATETPIVTSNCTDGILELMSTKKQIIQEDFILTESGIITPSFYKGRLDIPLDETVTNEEIIFSKAINKVLFQDDYVSVIKKNKEQLLSKFNLETIAANYLS